MTGETMLPESLKQAISYEFPKYPDKRAVLLTALHLAQKEFGHLPREVQEALAEFLGLEPIEVKTVVSFYSLFRSKPGGKHHIMVCHNISCSLLGSRKLINFIESKLGIKVGEVTPDGKFSLAEVECLGSCGTAPMMQINETYYENLTEKRIEEIIASLT